MINNLNKIKDIVNKFSIHSLNKELDILTKIIENADTINISVLGQFKSGKSSFINCLIGNSILPTGITPVTNVVTSLMYGETDKSTVIYLDKTTELIDNTKLHFYISEQENENNKKKINYLTVQTPLLSHLKHLQLIDTPGIGSAFAHNSKATSDWLPNTELSIILTSAIQPISEHDISLIEDTLKYCPEIAIVISKIDLLKSNEIDNVKRYVFTTLKKRFNKEFSIFIFSNKDDVYQKVLTKLLLRPINTNFELHRKNILNHKLHFITSQCINYLKILQKSKEKQINGEQKLLNQIIDEKLNFPLLKKELELIANNYILNVKSDVEQLLVKTYKKRCIDIIQTKFNTTSKKWTGNLKQTTVQFEEWTYKTINEEFTNIITTNKAKLNDILNTSTLHFSKYINSYKTKLNNKIETVLNVTMSDNEWIVEINKLKDINISTSYTFESHIDLLWFLFPMKIFKQLFFNYYKRQIPYEVEKNLYRISNEITEKITIEIQNSKQIAINYVNNELKTIETLLTTKDHSLSEINKTLEELETITQHSN